MGLRQTGLEFNGGFEFADGFGEAAGHPREGFPAGTPWSEVPVEWVCPDCGVCDKVDFTLAGTGEPAED